MNVWLPLFFFTGVSFASFAVEVTALSNRLSVCITILLTLVAYRFSMCVASERCDACFLSLTRLCSVAAWTSCPT
jgi:hypothetical protein